jgi:hypothetical protein
VKFKEYHANILCDLYLSKVKTEYTTICDFINTLSFN